MGYYSEVIIVIAKDAHEAFLNALAARAFELQCIGECSPAELLAAAEKEEHPDAVVYHWPFVKWYDNYDPDVMAIRDALKELDSDCYKFYRLGEEYGDFEEDGNYLGDPQFYMVHRLEMLS